MFTWQFVCAAVTQSSMGLLLCETLCAFMLSWSPGVTFCWNQCVVHALMGLLFCESTCVLHALLRVTSVWLHMCFSCFINMCMLLALRMFLGHSMVEEMCTHEIKYHAWSMLIALVQTFPCVPHRHILLHIWIAETKSLQHNLQPSYLWKVGYTSKSTKHATAFTTFTVSLLTNFGVTLFLWLQPWQSRHNRTECTSGTFQLIGLLLTWADGWPGSANVTIPPTALSTPGQVRVRTWPVGLLLGSAVPLTSRGFSLPVQTTTWFVVAGIDLP